MRLSSYLPIIVAMLLAGAASLGGAYFAVDRIEAGARAEVSLGLVRSGHDWTEVATDGLQVILMGTAPDEAARFDALTVAGRIVEASRVIDRMDVVHAKSIAPPRFSIEILRNLDGVSVIGLVPRSTDRDGLVARIRAASGEAPLADLVETADFPPPEGWEAALDYGLEALERVGRSKLSIAADAVTVSAIASSGEERRKLETELWNSAPEGLELTLDIKAPRPVIAPFTVRFVIDGRGAHFDACSADTEAAQTKIVEAAVAAGLQDKAPCRIGLGVPSVEWGDAVADGIATVARMGAGRITFSDADVTVVAPETVSQEVFDREIGELKGRLPKAFSLHAVLNRPAATEGSGNPEAETAPEFTATRSPEGLVQLRGRVADELSLRTVESFAQSRFGVANTRVSVRTDGAVPPGWGLRVLAALEALARLNNGLAVVRPDTVSVSGATGDEDAPAEVAGLLSQRLGGGADFDVEIRYLESLDPLAGLPTPEECVARINAVAAARKITFDPGSSDIEAGALATIDEVAEVLKECQQVPMQIEIGGHTDSQGRESMNLRLSQARADAVLNAIMARRVLVGNLSARGYGEEQPIADNQTEDGREANRRIEFRLILPEEEAEPGEAEAAADAEGTEDEANGQN